jgi:thiol:disulfide interchange protein DsbC
MFQISKNIILSSLLLTSSAFAFGEVSKNEIMQMEKLELLKRAEIKITKAYDQGSLYLLNIKVRGKADEVYLTKDKKLLIAGDVIDTATGMKVSVPADLSGVIGKEAFTYGTGTDEYVLFTDPECPYCKKFESYFPQIADKVKIRVFFYPLEFHKNAKDLSVYILSKKTNEEKIKAMFEANVELEDFKNRKISDKDSAKLEAQLNEQIKISQDLNVQGTPTMFDAKGNPVVWVTLLQKYGIELK